MTVSQQEVETDAPHHTPASGPGDALYADHVKIHPRSVKGTFRRLKTTALYVLLGIYYLAPFLRWERGADSPAQAILIDLPGRRAYFFGIEIWPQEVYYITGLLVLGAIGLFLVTALLGRVWCGFACPQTVWTDLYLWVERWFEGDRNARIKLDRAPWTVGKAARKAAKHLVWLVIAAATGGAWILYFNDAPTVIPELFTGAAGTGVYTFFALFAATTYLLAGWAREQVCIYMCPWPRIQGGMFDEHSLIVSYEAWRGEPRGTFKKEQAGGRGHCVDCRLCVQVCPTGIDIRDGTQMACIGCALCIDACNGIMDRCGLPRGLIRYDSAVNLDRREKGEHPVYRLVRGRSIVYTLLLAVVGAVMLYGLLMRATVELSVSRERSPLYVALSDGSIRNTYTIKVMNMVRAPRSFTLRAKGVAGAAMSVMGDDGPTATAKTLTIESDTVGTFRVFVTVPRERMAASKLPLSFELIEGQGGETRSVKTIFVGPET